MAKMGYKFTFLSDEKTDVIRRYDLLHKGGGPKGSDISRPAEFLVDPLGKIVWMNLTESIGVRARPDDVATIYPAGPSHQTTEQQYLRFLFACASDPRQKFITSAICWPLRW